MNGMRQPKIDALELQEIQSAFDDPEWLFEIKHDGFRSLAYIDGGKCKLVSRNAHEYKRFADLRAAIPADVTGDAILDGEIVVLDCRRPDALQRGNAVEVDARLRGIRSALAER